MTIKGFTEYLKSDKDVNQLIELNKAIVILDGHLIQRQLNDISSQSQEENKYCDYTSYAENIKSFFRRLKISQIVPIIVFDGSINPNRYRMGFSDRIREIHQILKRGYHCRSQSPTLRNYVFTSVARSFGVEIIQTCSNTWPQVVSLDNKLMCPVYSQRKEFLFGGLENGIIDGSLTRSALHYNQNEKCWYLLVNILRIDCSVKKFKGLRLEVILNSIRGKSLDECLQSITHIVFPQIEDFSQPSSYDCTLRLRRSFYGILRTEVEKPSPIKVLDRTTLSDCAIVSTKEELVSPMIRISDSQELPNLANVRLLEMSERRKLFFSVIMLLLKPKAICSEPINSTSIIPTRKSLVEEWYVIVGLLFLALLFIAVIITMILCCKRKEQVLKKVETKVENKNPPKFGDLDSELELNIKVDEISVQNDPKKPTQQQKQVLLIEKDLKTESTRSTDQKTTDKKPIKQKI